VNIQQQVIQILIDYSGQDQIQLKTPIESINLDSLDMAEIACDIQDLFDIDIDETQLAAVKTVQELIPLIDSEITVVKLQHNNL
jgi:acyl carrier protein